MKLLDVLSASESKSIHKYWVQLESEFIDLGFEYFSYVYATACWLQIEKRKAKERKYSLGISGAQGSGKSTFSRLLALTLELVFGSTALVLSLDDFYLPRKERLKLSKKIHPLLQTRGVPGTHDIDLMEKVLAATDQISMIPIFDKSIDDRRGFQETDQSHVDIVIVEGWCWGAKPTEAHELEDAINTLESEQDQEGKWRQYVNNQLVSYQSIFANDASIFLAVPDMQSVFEWRWQQESEMKSGSKRMSKAEIQGFIMYFERISRRMLQQMPEEADLVLNLDSEHRIESAHLQASQV